MTEHLLIECLGWIGAFLLSVCGIPQLYKTYKTGTTRGLSLTMLLCWLIGEVCLGTYVVIEAFEWPLLFNFIINSVIVAATVILYWKYRND